MYIFYFFSFSSFKRVRDKAKLNTLTLVFVWITLHITLNWSTFRNKHDTRSWFTLSQNTHFICDEIQIQTNRQKKKETKLRLDYVYIYILFCDKASPVSFTCDICFSICWATVMRERKRAREWKKTKKKDCYLRLLSVNLCLLIFSISVNETLIVRATDSFSDMRDSSW